MLSNYWKNKLEEEKNLESLQNLYKDEVMKYRLRKAAGEQYYSTIFKPITGKLEETIEPLKQLKELSKRMLPPAPVPPAIEAPVTGPEGEEDGEEFKMVIYPDEDFDKSVLDKYEYKLPSHFVGKDVKEISNVIKEVGHKKGGLQNKINNIKDGKEKNELNRQYETLVKYNDTLMGIRKYIKIKKTTTEEPKEEGAVGGVEEIRREIKIPKVLKTNIDEGLDIENIRKHGFKPPSEYKDLNKEELNDVIKNVDNINEEIKEEIDKLGIEMINFAAIANTTLSDKVKDEC